MCNACINVSNVYKIQTFICILEEYLGNCAPTLPQTQCGKWFKIEGACRPRTLGMFRLRYEMNKFTVNYCSRSTI